MLACDGHDAHQQLVRVKHACRVVRVDDHHRFGTRRDFGAYVSQVGHPAIGLVAEVMHGCAARQRSGCCPERVIGHGQQQLVAVVKQCVGGHGDELTCAVAQVNVVQRDTLDALLLCLVHHRLARRKNTLAVRVACRVGQVANHVLLDFFRRIKTKHRQVAQVQFDNLLAFVFHLARRVHDGPTNVVKHIGQLGRFGDGFHWRIP